MCRRLNWPGLAALTAIAIWCGAWAWLAWQALGWVRG